MSSIFSSTASINPPAVRAPVPARGEKKQGTKSRSVAPKYGFEEASIQHAFSAAQSPVAQLASPAWAHAPTPQLAPSGWGSIRRAPSPPPVIPHETPESPQSVASPVQPTPEIVQRFDTPPIVSTPPTSFKSMRHDIFRQIHVEVMNGGKMADVQLSLLSRRATAGPRELPARACISVNKRLLSAASPAFEKCTSSVFLPM